MNDDHPKPERLRSPITYYGGKGMMLAKLLPLIPAGGAPYVEPFLGGGSVFFARDPAKSEAINDLDGDVINLMRCLQDLQTFDELRHRLCWTAYSRAEFARAIDTLKNPDAAPVDRAWAKFVGHNQGTSGIFNTVGNWGRHLADSRATKALVMRLSRLDAWRLRLLHAQIDNRCALEVIRYWDTPDAVIYCDPPYVAATRAAGSRSVYRNEFDDAHHRALVDALLACRGAVVLSGYDHPVHQPLVDAGWQRIDFATACHAAGRGRGSGLQGVGAALAKVPRVESVWRNPRAVELAPARP